MSIPFKIALENAIDNYQSTSIKNKKKLSHHRAKAIIDLRGLIKEEDNLIVLRSKIIDYLQKIRTGFWFLGIPIYQTGNSLLKDNLIKVIDNPAYLLVNITEQDDVDLRTITYGDNTEQFDDDYLEDESLGVNNVSQPRAIPSASINDDPPDESNGLFSKEKRILSLTSELRKSNQEKMTLENEKNGIIKQKEATITSLKNSLSKATEGNIELCKQNISLTQRCRLLEQTNQNDTRRAFSV